MYWSLLVRLIELWNPNYTIIIKARSNLKRNGIITAKGEFTFIPLANKEDLAEEHVQYYIIIVKQDNIIIFIIIVRFHVILSQYSRLSTIKR